MILHPKNQLNLYGYDTHLLNFINLYENNKMPNSVLISGLKGSGKSTFVYHLINYLLSKNENNKYELSNYSINVDNFSYKRLCLNAHPNFYLIENSDSEKNIKIEQIRNLINFINKTTYSQDLKIILIDNAEYLNLNSSNALLKVLEEPSKKTFFFIIQNNAYPILETIKSRCTEFKMHLKPSIKKYIFDSLLKQYQETNIYKDIVGDFYFDSPGNLLKYTFLLANSQIDADEDKLDLILFLIKEYENKKNSELLAFITTFIQKFYNELCLNTDRNNLNGYLLRQSSVFKYIYDMKKFNLYEKNYLTLIKETLINEKR